MGNYCSLVWVLDVGLLDWACCLASCCTFGSWISAALTGFSIGVPPRLIENASTGPDDVAALVEPMSGDEFRQVGMLRPWHIAHQSMVPGATML